MWLDSDLPAAASASADLDTSFLVADIPTVQEGGDVAMDPSLNNNLLVPPVSLSNDLPVLPAAEWPADTDLVSVSGTNRLALMLQHPPVHAIIHDSFENVRAYILFDHSFPDAVAVPTIIRDCLIAAATESHNPRAPVILRRMTEVNEYMTRLSRLVSVP